ncbi:hypothetical protein WGT02_11400 [Rhizobium sp. T1470]|uniref:hypothetical protein n=1 Tax=unclassified Rhizobium TaxID=2613769 RepID=UPI001AAE49C5|nr:hypothetical protein [Rhizobium sp. T1473]MCA0801844.1 hypothetical protein [Rhizobium sp. T1473]
MNIQTHKRAFNPSNEERLAKVTKAEEPKFRCLRSEEAGKEELWFAVAAAGFEGAAVCNPVRRVF